MAKHQTRDIHETADMGRDVALHYSKIDDAHREKEGTTVPSDGTAGYMPGASFLHRDGSGDFDKLYFNTGSATSCAFRTIRTNQGWIPIPLAIIRAAGTNDIVNLAGHGGILATDSTPTLEYTNGDTDSALRMLWATSGVEPIVFQTPLPPDFDPANDLVLHGRFFMSGTSDTPVIDIDTFFNEADSKVSDAFGAITGATPTEYTATIAAGDIPSDAQTVSIEATPAAHGSDTLTCTALWLEYTKLFLAT